MKFPHWPAPSTYKNIELGLVRVRALLTRLGNPECALPPVVHVAGTNGKGSTIAFIRAMLEAAGLRVHVYTSPHLVEFNERIVVAGEVISDAMLYAMLEECRIAAGELPVTFFEGTTTAAFLAFSRVSADVVLLETGLGGRLDATNVIAKPVLTVITSIGMDHTEFLGNTLAEIAAEKAAIMKPGVSCVSAPQRPEVMEVLERAAREVGAMLMPGDENIVLPELALKGAHQHINARVAVAAVQVLTSSPESRSDSRAIYLAASDGGAIEQQKLTPQQVRGDTILRGLQTARWPARLQQLQEGKLAALLPENAELWLDGGHNADAGEVLASQARVWLDKPLILIAGMLGNKDAAGFLAPLAPYITALYAVGIPGEPSAIMPEEMAGIARKTGIKETYPAESVRTALAAIAARGGKNFRVLICGSLYLAGTVLAENNG